MLLPMKIVHQFLPVFMIGSCFVAIFGCDLSPSGKMLKQGSVNSFETVPELNLELKALVSSEELEQLQKIWKLQAEDVKLFNDTLSFNDEFNLAPFWKRLMLTSAKEGLARDRKKIQTELTAALGAYTENYWGELFNTLGHDQSQELRRHVLRNWNPLAFLLKKDLSALASEEAKQELLNNVLSLPSRVTLGLKQSWFTYVSLEAALEEYRVLRQSGTEALAASREVASQRAPDIAADIRKAVRFPELKDCLRKSIAENGEFLLDDNLDRPEVLDSLATGQNLGNETNAREHIAAQSEYGKCFTLASHAYAALKLGADTQALNGDETQILAAAYKAVGLMFENLYNGHNAKLLEIKFREPVPGNSGNIDSFILSGRYTVGSIWWSEPSQVSSITASSSKSPLKFLYGSKSARDIYWPLESGEKAEILVEELLRSEDAQEKKLTKNELRLKMPHLDSLRVAVNSSLVGVQRETRSVEVFARDSAGIWQPFVYYQRGEKLLPSKSFLGKPVPGACATCHMNPESGIMSPRPYKLVGSQAQAQERGYHHNFTSLLMKY